MQFTSQIKNIHILNWIHLDTCTFNPSFTGQDENNGPSHVFKPLEFEGFKTTKINYNKPGFQIPKLPRTFDEN